MRWRTNRRISIAAWIFALLGPIGLTAVLIRVNTSNLFENAAHFGTFVYLALVVAVAFWRGIWPALVCAVESAIIIVWFFLLPLGTFDLQHREDQVHLFEFAGLSIIFGLLADRQRRAYLRTEERLQVNSDLAVDLASASLQVEHVTDRLLRRAAGVLRARSVSIIRREGDAVVVEQSYPPDNRLVQPGARLTMGSSRARDALRGGRPVYVRQPGFEGGITQLAEVPLPPGGERPLFLVARRGWWPRFQADDLRTMRIVAYMGGLALHNAALFTEVNRAREATSSALRVLEDRNREATALLEFGRLAISRASAEELLQATVDILARMLDVELAVVAEVRSDGQTALLRAGHGLKPGLVGRAVVPAIAGTPTTYLMRTDDQSQVSELLRDHGVVSGISALVRVEGILVTELGAFSTRPRTFSQADRRFLERILTRMSQALIAIRSEHALEKSMEQLRRTDRARRELLARLVTAVEDERDKIARDIHDDALQALAAIALRLQLVVDEIKDEDQRRLLERLPPALDESMNRLRALIFDLRADELDEGIAPALRLYMDGVRAAGDPDSRIVSRLDVEPPMETRLVVYRIAQEALSNVRKHAEATHVEVELESRDAGVQVTIRDDGRGFDPAAATHGSPGHLGLAAMRERADLAGGELRVESSPGRGTTVTFWIPIPAIAA